MRHFDIWVFPSALTVTHATAANGDDRTLCGLALEGENGDDVAASMRGKISCDDCARIITHCQVMGNSWRA